MFPFLVVFFIFFMCSHDVNEIKIKDFISSQSNKEVDKSPLIAEINTISDSALAYFDNLLVLNEGLGINVGRLALDQGSSKPLNESLRLLKNKSDVNELATLFSKDCNDAEHSIKSCIFPVANVFYINQQRTKMFALLLFQKERTTGIKGVLFSFEDCPQGILHRTVYLYQLMPTGCRGNQVAGVIRLQVAGSKEQVCEAYAQCRQ